MSKRIESTLLKIDAPVAQIEELCDDAVKNEFRAVCCLPRDVAFCKERLARADVRLATVLNFPLAGWNPDQLPQLSRSLIADGADEIDMVIDVRSILEGRISDATAGIQKVVDASPGIPIKVILETCLLTEIQVVESCAAARKAGAAFVKTSTGFSHQGATTRDVEIMKTAVGDTMRIKASGGISTHKFAAELIDAGADVIGTSKGKACITP